MKICKYALEVSRRSTNLAVIGELGRYPLYLEVLLNMIKYWARLTKLDNCLAVEALKTSKDIHAQNQKSWFSSITEIFDYFKIEKNKVLNIKTTLKNYINNKIPLKFKELWRNSLFDDNRRASCNNKLRTYRLFKDKFIQENYLKWENFCQRRLITKFRISSHNLEIEHGRYFNISADQRICKLCKLTVEDEIHFLLECPKLEEARHEFQIFG